MWRASEYQTLKVRYSDESHNPPFKYAIKEALTQKRVDDVLKHWDEDQNEDSVGNLDRVGQKLEAVSESRFHSGRLEGPRWALVQCKTSNEISANTEAFHVSGLSF